MNNRVEDEWNEGGLRKLNHNLKPTKLLDIGRSGGPISNAMINLIRIYEDSNIAKALGRGDSPELSALRPKLAFPALLGWVEWHSG